MKRAERKSAATGPAAGERAFTLLKSPDGKADDLSLIGGVGPKIYQRLKEWRIGPEGQRT